MVTVVLPANLLFPSLTKILESAYSWHPTGFSWWNQKPYCYWAQMKAQAPEWASVQISSGTPLTSSSWIIGRLFGSLVVVGHCPDVALVYCLYTLWDNNHSISGNLPLDLAVFWPLWVLLRDQTLAIGTCKSSSPPIGRWRDGGGLDK